MILALFGIAIMAAIGGAILFALFGMTFAYPLVVISCLLFVGWLCRYFWLKEIARAAATPPLRHIQGQSHRPNTSLRQSARIHDEQSALDDPHWFGDEDEPLT